MHIFVTFLHIYACLTCFSSYDVHPVTHADVLQIIIELRVNACMCAYGHLPLQPKSEVMHFCQTL